MIRETRDNLDSGVENTERVVEAEKGALLARVLGRIFELKDAASKVYFDGKLDEENRKFSSEKVNRAFIPMGEAFLGKRGEAAPDLKKGSVRFAIGLVIALKDTLGDLDESKINPESKLGKMTLACKRLLGNEYVSMVAERAFQKQI